MSTKPYDIGDSSGSIQALDDAGGNPIPAGVSYYSNAGVATPWDRSVTLASTTITGTVAVTQSGSWTVTAVGSSTAVVDPTVNEIGSLLLTTGASDNDGVQAQHLGAVVTLAAVGRASSAPLGKG